MQRLCLLLTVLWSVAGHAQAAAQSPQPAGKNAAGKQAFGPTGGDVSIEDWKRDDWMLVKPQVSLLDLNGYFRLRGDLLRRLDFGNAAGLELPPNWSPTDSTFKSDLNPTYDKSVVGQANTETTNM